MSEEVEKRIKDDILHHTIHFSKYNFYLLTKPRMVKEEVGLASMRKILLSPDVANSKVPASPLNLESI